MKIRGIGVDVLNYSRFQPIKDFYRDKGIQKIFTNFEISMSQSHENPIGYFSSRFAAKEAVLKSLNIDLNLIQYTDIEIYANDFNKPCVRLLGNIKEHIDLKSVEQIEVSISYEKELVVAYAITTEKEEM